MMIAAIVLGGCLAGGGVLVTLAVLLGAKGTTTTTTTSVETAGRSAPSASAAPTPPPLLVLNMGEIAIGDSGRTYRAVTFAAPIRSDNEFDTPPPGGFFGAAQVEICNNNPEAYTVNPLSFIAELADNTQVQSTFLAGMPASKPPLNLATVQPASCVRGWVFWPLPSKPAYIVLDRSNIRWRVP